MYLLLINISLDHFKEGKEGTSPAGLPCFFFSLTFGDYFQPHSKARKTIYKDGYRIE